MSPAQFVDSVSRLSFENTFNPYSNRCGVHDVRDAPQLRSQTLLRVLEVAEGLDVDSIWVGRDLGYRGGRRTGLAFTDDVHIDEYARRWGISVRQPTSGGTYAERTATVVWRVLSRIALPVFLWNVFPLHPHEPGNPFSRYCVQHVTFRSGTSATTKSARQGLRIYPTMKCLYWVRSSRAQRYDGAQPSS